jgi:hypothetical protein
VLALVDIREQKIPSGYCTFRVAHGLAPNLEPSIHSVSPSTAVLNLIDLARFDAFDAGINYARQVVRMHSANEGPVLQFVICLAEILQRLAIEELDLAQCAHCSHQAWNVVDNLPPGQLSGTQVLFSLLAIFDVDIGSISFDDCSHFISQRVGAKQKPAIGPIQPPQPRFHLARSAGGQ